MPGLWGDIALPPTVHDPKCLGLLRVGSVSPLVPRSMKASNKMLAAIAVALMGMAVATGGAPNNE